MALGDLTAQSRQLIGDGMELGDLTAQSTWQRPHEVASISIDLRAVETHSRLYGICLLEYELGAEIKM
jgi:hypothetical protein